MDHGSDIFHGVPKHGWMKTLKHSSSNQSKLITSYYTHTLVTVAFRNITMNYMWHACYQIKNKIGVLFVYTWTYEPRNLVSYHATCRLKIVDPLSFENTTYEINCLGYMSCDIFKKTLSFYYFYNVNTWEITVILI